MSSSSENNQITQFIPWSDEAAAKFPLRNFSFQDQEFEAIDIPKTSQVAFWDAYKAFYAEGGGKFELPHQLVALAVGLKMSEFTLSVIIFMAQTRPSCFQTGEVFCNHETEETCNWKSLEPLVTTPSERDGSSDIGEENAPYVQSKPPAASGKGYTFKNNTVSTAMDTTKDGEEEGEEVSLRDQFNRPPANPSPAANGSSSRNKGKGPAKDDANSLKSSTHESDDDNDGEDSDSEEEGTSKRRKQVPVSKLVKLMTESIQQGAFEEITQRAIEVDVIKHTPDSLKKHPEPWVELKKDCQIALNADEAASSLTFNTRFCVGKVIHVAEELQDKFNDSVKKSSKKLTHKKVHQMLGLNRSETWIKQSKAFYSKYRYIPNIRKVGGRGIPFDTVVRKGDDIVEAIKKLPDEQRAIWGLKPKKK